MSYNSNVSLFIQNVNEIFTYYEIWDRIEFYNFGKIYKIVLLPISKKQLYGPNTRNVIVHFDYWYRTRDTEQDLYILLKGKPIYIYHNQWKTSVYDPKHKKKMKKMKQAPIKKMIKPIEKMNQEPQKPTIMIQPVEEDDTDYPELYEDLFENTQNKETNTNDDIQNRLLSIEQSVLQMSKFDKEQLYNKNVEYESKSCNKDYDDKEQSIDDDEEQSMDDDKEQSMDENKYNTNNKCGGYMDIDSPKELNYVIDYGEAILPPKRKNRPQPKLNTAVTTNLFTIPEMKNFGVPPKNPSIKKKKIYYTNIS